ncbi:FHA domain-containing protein [Amycolatopsis sp. OK19-0408]|uniref:FHA domain-containing protein n=1 Tax=Amycolatopsis iheyensis TaxID=2945988 RepID=A0A9X2SKI2_9PSEU|nr:FHA domain-containing protein [Amycolatopsis iheyensis]MCR6483881.1 FHA domain-containing protein [Amycolatopsis iheyensis]
MGQVNAAEIETVDGAVARLAVRRGTWLVGRGPEAHLRLHSGHVSPRHAWIRCDARGTRVTDAGSRTGTWVNGQRLAEHETRLLRDGDRLSFGPIGAVFSDVPAAEGARPRPGRVLVAPGLLMVVAGFGLWASAVDGVPLGIAGFVVFVLGAILTVAGVAMTGFTRAPENPAPSREESR